MINLICGDCLNELPKINANSIDLILTDLPYGVTANPADKALPLKVLWQEWKRLLKPNGLVVLTSQFPYTIDLVTSNQSWFRYDLIWDKVLATGHLNSKKMPLRVHEHILVFYNQPGCFNPQKVLGPKSHTKRVREVCQQNNYGAHRHVDNSAINGHLKYPTSILTLPKCHASVALHPTEKPVELAEYLIKTYTLENDCVLDCCMGVGWSAVASKRLNRNFVGIEINPKYFEIAKKRVGEIPARLELFTTPLLVASNGGKNSSEVR